jgi:hypothetical protein
MNLEDSGSTRRLARRADAREVFDEVLCNAQRRLRLFDDDGRFWGLERRSVAQALRRMLCDRPDAAVTLILHELSFVERHCPLIVDLVRAHAPRLQVRITSPNVRALARGVVIVDGTVTLRRPQFGQLVSFVDRDEGAIIDAGRWFDELFQASEPGLAGRVTGL